MIIVTEFDHFECNISEEGMNRENSLNLLIDEDDDAIGEETCMHIFCHRRKFFIFHRFIDPPLI